MKTVSVIVPVHNTEKFLRRCFDSLINQTLNDIEVILIDDASSDQSPLIMKEYEDRFPHIVKCIYLKENIRQGGARNRGLEIASGQFVTFVDSDDWVDITMCEKLYRKAQETDSDIVYCDHFTINELTGKKRHHSTIYKEQTGEVTEEIMKSLLFQKHHIVVKLIKRSLIQDNHIFFPERMLYEDIAVVILYCLYAKKIEKVYEALYYYNIHENSTVQTSNNQRQIQEAVLILIDRMRQRGFYEKYRDEIDMVFIYDYYIFPMYKALTLFDRPLIEHMNYLSENMRKLMPNYKDNPYYIKCAEPYFAGIAEMGMQSVEVLLQKYNQGEIREENYHYFDYYKAGLCKIKKVIDYCTSHNLRIASWGAGPKGKDFLKIADPDGTQIQYVIDSNQKIHNQVLATGHIVRGLSDVIEDIDLILVVNMNYFQEIEDEVRTKNKKIIVFNLDLFIRFELPFSWFIMNRT